MLTADLIARATKGTLPAGVSISAAGLTGAYTRSTEITHWDVRYSQPVDLPTRLVAKSALSPPDFGSIMREVEFYEKARSLASKRFLPRLLGCLSTQELALLVLEDLGPEFASPVAGVSMAPPLDVNLAVFRTLSAIHQELWQHAHLNEFSVEMLSSRFSGLMAQQQTGIRENLQSRANAVLAIPLFQRLMVTLPGTLRAVLSRGSGITFIHGDCHPGNVLVAEHGGTTQAMVIDWPNWQPGTPTDDLAYYLCLCFPVDDRRAQEGPLLRHYYDSLSNEIKTGYSWDRFMADYRVSIIRSLAVALLWVATPAPAQWAWDSLNFILEAFVDWDCNSVLPVRAR